MQRSLYFNHFNKKGLSSIVTMLVILLLVFVAIGIVWLVVGDLVKDSSDQISFKTKCLETSVRPINVSNPSSGIYRVRLSKSASTELIGGVKLTFSSEDFDENFLYDVPGDIAALGIKNVDVSVTKFIPDKVQANVYFLSESGEEQLCTTANSYEF